jgi:hypothetical protein
LRFLEFFRFGTLDGELVPEPSDLSVGRETVSSSSLPAESFRADSEAIFAEPDALPNREGLYLFFFAILRTPRFEWRYSLAPIGKFSSKRPVLCALPHFARQLPHEGCTQSGSETRESRIRRERSAPSFRSRLRSELNYYGLNIN